MSKQSTIARRCRSCLFCDKQTGNSCLLARMMLIDDGRVNSAICLISSPLSRRLLARMMRTQPANLCLVGRKKRQLYRTSYTRLQRLPVTKHSLCPANCLVGFAQLTFSAHILVWQLRKPTVTRSGRWDDGWSTDWLAVRQADSAACVIRCMDGGRAGGNVVA
jgi:hypothetical protein